MSVRRMVHIDPRLCEGHALCLDIAPEVFDVGDDDVATCAAEPTGPSWQRVHAAMDACPRGAISVSETADVRETTEAPEQQLDPAR